MRMFLSLGSSFTTSSVYSNIPSATAATTTASAVAHQVRISDSPVRWRIKLSLCVFLRAVGALWEWKIAFKMTKNSKEKIPFKLWMYASKVLIWCKSQARNAEVLYVCAQHVYCVLWLEIRMLDIVIYKRILKAFVMYAKVQLKLQYFCLWVREEIHRKWMLLGSSFDHRGFILLSDTEPEFVLCSVILELLEKMRLFPRIVTQPCVESFHSADHVCLLFHFSTGF